ncbi:hypothetical protein PUNSTDRAFT_130103 [Punctularia strigosozonata HHB-11173 SS5]|uniref:uncharacterized protein n=1 Tax=Punctularia strigosozonata (strain HHB-11173) TaxID=741275 RepID=UPI0004418562|nr:uncharacterized protein PUNSTDRAFT_130103 [Punctularia strigosozonata HHB-11173 SS5]EIN14476.1 hypothetical protein PUNSTDRAFT_130103 [Punctularia strigosozonata HHB-11173 SS5]
MRYSFALVLAALVSASLAAPAKRQFTPGQNVNQGSDRPVILQADGSALVDGIRAANDDLGSQIACLLDERDCLSADRSSSECTNDRIGCQSGNALNGLVAPLNAESATPGKRSLNARQFATGTNVNQGSDRPVIQQADGTVFVDSIHAANGDLGSQIACLLDEKDCLAAGTSSTDCTNQRIGCQSGNALNGLSAKMNNESA